MCLKLNLCIAVPPKLSPFYAEDTLHVGDRATLTCAVTKGDEPLTIAWHKDGRQIVSSQMQMHIQQVDSFTSILLIESLSQEHNGNYSCVVRNLAAEVSHTQQLVVNGNPHTHTLRARMEAARAAAILFIYYFDLSWFISGPMRFFSYLSDGAFFSLCLFISQFLPLSSPFPFKTGSRKACEPVRCAALAPATNRWSSPG